MEYLDFIIYIDKSDGYHLVRSDFDLTSKSEETEFDIQSLGTLRAELVDLITAESNQNHKLDEIAQKLGDELFRSLPNQIRTHYAVAHFNATQQEQGIRIKLNVTDPLLAVLPWEFLRYEDNFLVLQTSTPLVRWSKTDDSHESLADSELRILAVIADPEDNPVPHARIERRNLRAEFSENPQIVIDFLDEIPSVSAVTLNNIREILRQKRSANRPYHILHFIGHGYFSEPEQKGYLLFENEDGTSRHVNHEQVGQIIGDHALSLVVLNSCEGAQASEISALSGVATSLMYAGIPAVIAMQFPIVGNTAVQFAKAFYQAIRDGDSVDESVAEGRRAILAESDGTIEWAAPVLFTRYIDGQLLDLTDNTKSIPDVTKPIPDIPATRKTLNSPINDIELQFPYGTMHPTSKFYIGRQADSDCLSYCSQDSAFTIHVMAPHQMGKSSLIERICYLIKQTRDVEIASIDFEKFTQEQMLNLEVFLIELCDMISDSLDIPAAIEEYWSSPRRSNLIKCSNYLSDHILSTINKPLILVMDRLERVLDAPFRNDFFGMLRAWHNDRAKENLNWKELSLFLSSSTEPQLFIDNPKQSPFNVAQKVILNDFSLEAIQELNDLHPIPLTQTQLISMMDLFGGQPFLIRLALYLVSKKLYDFDTLMRTAALEDGPFENHLDRLWGKISSSSDLRQALSQICRHQTYPTDKLYYRLKGAGLIKRAGKKVMMRNQLYELYFMRRLHG